MKTANKHIKSWANSLQRQVKMSFQYIRVVNLQCTEEYVLQCIEDYLVC